MGVPTIAIGALKKLMNAAIARGADAGELARAADVPAEVLGDPDARAPLARLHAVWDAVLAAGVAIDFEADAYAPGEYGIVGFVVMNSATLSEGLDHLVRYIGLWTDDPAFQREGSAVRFTYRTAFHTACSDAIGARASGSSSTSAGTAAARARPAASAPRAIAAFISFFSAPLAMVGTPIPPRVYCTWNVA